MKPEIGMRAELGIMDSNGFTGSGEPVNGFTGSGEPVNGHHSEPEYTYRKGDQSSNNNKIERMPSSGESSQQPHNRKILRERSTELKARKFKKVHFMLQKTGKRKWEFHPYDSRNKYIQRWRFFVLMPLAYEVWAFPYRLALGVPSISSDMQLIISDFACDLWILLDMLVTLWTEVPVGVGQDKPITTFLGIADNFFKSQFQLQILPSFPYWAAMFYVTNYIQDECAIKSSTGHSSSEFSWTCIVTNQDWPVALWWAFSIPRLLPRLTRLILDFKKMESNLEITVRALQVIKFAVLIFLSAHWVGCLFYFIARIYDFGPTTWVYEMEKFLPLFSRFGSSISIDYLLCIYKGFSGLASLEYIITYPNNAGELIFNIIVMVTAIWLQGVILGTILNYMVEKDPVAEAHRRQLEELARFVEDKNLPQELGMRLFKYFEFQYQKAVENRASSSIQLPRSLAIKLQECKYRGAIDKCTARGEFLYGCDAQFLNALLMKLKVVFYMPNEEVFKKDDLSRELCLVLSGACSLLQDEKVKRVVRDDVPNMAPVLGELAFFMGILQPMAVRARSDGDVQLLVLSREDGNDLFDSYPEQLEIICGNILGSFGLDRHGQEIAQTGDEEDADTAALKASIVQAISRQNYETFASLKFAAKAGDVEMVRDLLRRGADMDAVDYDGRSAFSMACYEGSFKVVELFLEAGVDRDMKNRWNQTPLEEAMSNRQGPVVELLSQWKAGTDVEKASNELRTAAARGDMDQLRRLIDSGANPDEGDYDSRTAMHVACTKGDSKVVEFLINSKASVNSSDRWGCTPLQEAVENGNQQLVSMLRDKGGTMSEARGSTKVADSAAKGDVQSLILLIKFAGLKKNFQDFDLRTPLHRAASEAKLLAVSYLLGIAANPNIKDRWGFTPLDYALRGGTLYHMYCARLLQGWGGELGALEGTLEGEERLQELSKISIHCVRELVDKLIEKGYDRRTPTSLGDQELLQSWEASLQMVNTLDDMQEAVGRAMHLVQAKTARIRQVFEHFNSFFVPYLCVIPVKGSSSTHDDLSKLLENLDETYCRNRDPDEEEDAMFGIDSDEEARLFEELDQLLDAQERIEVFRSDSRKFMANSFQKTFLRIFELEEAIELVCFAFRRINGQEPTVSTADELHQGLERLSVNDVSEYDLECMIEDGIECMRTCANIFRNKVDSENPGCDVPISCLIAGSEKFRSILLKLKTDPIFCTLMNTPLADMFSEGKLKKLCVGARSVELNRSGAQVYSTSQKERGIFYFLVSGKLQVKLGNDSASNFKSGNAKSQASGAGVQYDIFPGELFGSCPPLTGDEDPVHVRVEVLDPCTFLELNIENVAVLLAEDKSVGAKFLTKFAEPWKSQAINRSGRRGSVSDEAGRRGSVSDETENGDANGAGASILRFLEANGSAGSKVQTGNDFSQKKAFLSSQNSSFASSSRFGALKQDRILSELELETIKNAFEAIDTLWRDISMGSTEVQVSLMLSIQENIGEIGSELFRELFINHADAQSISRRQFWAVWMNFCSDGGLNSDSMQSVESVPLLKDGDEESVEHDDAKPDPVHDVGFFEKLHARYAPSRRLKNKFFDENVLERYEQAFLTIAGDLKKPISSKRIPEFLEMLFPSFSHRFSSYNVNETLEIFGRNGIKSRELYWADIRKGLREKKTLGGLGESMLIESALNPSSWPVQYWLAVIRFVAIYHFIAVPIRITFLPWPSMIDTRALATDLVADLLTFMNIIVLSKTAQLNSRALWITKASRLMRRINLGYIIAAIPLDWFAWLCGASNPLCCWLRLIKLALPITLLIFKSRAQSAVSSKEASSSHKLFSLCGVGFSVIHIGACIWFYMGSQYANWFPGKGITWYAIEHSLESRAFTDHHGMFGAGDGATVWEQYLTSFYWITTTVTATGLVGNVIPANTMEISYCIVLMVINLTLFRYVTGEVSAIVMKADERIVAARSQLEAMETLLQDKRIGKELREEIRGHFRVSQSRSTIDQSSLFSHMSHSLKVEVASCTAREYLDNVALFQGCGEKLLDSVSVLLREVQFAPEEYVYRVGEIAAEMFFVVSGSLDELAEKDTAGIEKLERSVHQGCGTGELPFFFGMRHFGSARANRRTGAVCLRLPRDQFLPLLKLFPDDEERIAQAALTTYDGRSPGSRSKAAGSVAQRSHFSASGKSAKSGKSGKSGLSKNSSKKSKNSSNKSKGTKSVASDESDDGDGGGTNVSTNQSASDDSDDSVKFAVVDGMHHRLEALKQRRRNDCIDQTLSAAAKGELGLLKQALKSESVNISDGLKRTPLHVAASEGQLEIVRFLIDQGADVNAQDKFKNTCLNDAVRHRHDHVAKFLRERGATLVLEGSKAGVLMCQAAFEGNIPDVKRLLINKVSPSAADDQGRTALHVAASEGHISLVQYLLECKADVHCRDRFHGSALDDAVRHGRIEIQKLLRGHGATLDVESSAIKMCEYAASGDVDAIKILVENGVDPTIGSYDDRTAAHLAASNGMVSVLDYLLSQPTCEANPIDKMGGTPLEDALRHKKNVVVELVKDRGGISSSDPSLPLLKQAQAERLGRIRRQQRQPRVAWAVAESIEEKGCRFMRDDYVPGLRGVLDALEAKAAQLQASVEDCIPIVHSVLSKYGLFDVEIAVLSATPKAPALRPYTTKQIQKALDTLLQRIGSFAAHASGAIEALSADLSRYKAIQILAKGYAQEAASLRVLLKVCLKVVKKSKSRLQEIRTLSGPKPRSRQRLLSTMGSTTAALDNLLRRASAAGADGGADSDKRGSARVFTSCGSDSPVAQVAGHHQQPGAAAPPPPTGGRTAFAVTVPAADHRDPAPRGDSDDAEGGGGGDAAAKRHAPSAADCAPFGGGGGGGGDAEARAGSAGQESGGDGSDANTDIQII